MHTTRTHNRLGAIGCALALAAVGFVAPTAASADTGSTNVVINGNFAKPDNIATNSFKYVTTLPGWTFDRDHAEVQSYGYVSPPTGSPAGTQAADLNPGGPETIKQTLPTSAGTQYVLTFDLGGNTVGGPAAKTGYVSIDGTHVGSLYFDTTGHSRGQMGWTHKHITFTASGPTTLAFTSTTDGIYGPMITNVTVGEVVGAPMAAWQVALPVLAGLALLGGGLVWFRRRRSPGTVPA